MATLSRIQEHVEAMTRDGWELVSTACANLVGTPVMMFWRR